MSHANTNQNPKKPKDLHSFRVSSALWLARSAEQRIAVPSPRRSLDDTSSSRSQCAHASSADSAATDGRRGKRHPGSCSEIGRAHV